MRTRHFAPALLILALTGILFAEPGDGEWLHKVPPKDRARPNPFASDPDAPVAGAKIFADHCAACHGEDAAGKTQGKHIRPNLHADRVKQATAGDPGGSPPARTRGARAKLAPLCACRLPADFASSAEYNNLRSMSPPGSAFCDLPGSPSIQLGCYDR